MLNPQPLILNKVRHINAHLDAEGEGRKERWIAENIWPYMKNFSAKTLYYS